LRASFIETTMLGWQHMENVSDVCALLRAFQAEMQLFSIAVYRIDGDYAVRVATEGAMCRNCDRVHLSTGNIGMVARTGRAHITGDVLSDPNYASCFSEVQAEAVVPVLLVGRVVGVVDAEARHRADLDVDALSAFAARIANSMGRAFD
jgi:GAF domain-containing protein